jgi:thiol-disulfide isomerase/thioredoxin
LLNTTTNQHTTTTTTNYYSWCPHCQHFRDHYIEFAEQTAAVLREFGLDEKSVTFYAVSCTANQKLCRKVGIKGFPRVQLYAAGAVANATADVKYWKLHPFDVLRELDIHVDRLKVEPILEKASASQLGGREQLRTQRLQYQYARTKQQLFDDASLSFDHTLRQGIFASTPPGVMLTNATRDTLYDWLRLLQKTTPSAWQVQRTIHAILSNFDEAVMSEENLKAILERVPPTPPASSKKWSPACTKGVNGMGYSCGLWQLFHIMSVGLVEYNLMIGSEDPSVLEAMSVSTVHLADTLRNFVEHFFACEECRRHFVKDYDGCSYERCSRLSSHAYNYDQWIQLPTWLFETHNAVNQRLVRERAAREQREISDEEVHQSQWPSHQVCPKCWSDSGGYDDEVVYKFLRTEYWYDSVLFAHVVHLLV